MTILHLKKKKKKGTNNLIKFSKHKAFKFIVNIKYTYIKSTLKQKIDTEKSRLIQFNDNLLYQKSK